jgi:hypothetical protein
VLDNPKVVSSGKPFFFFSLLHYRILVERNSSNGMDSQLPYFFQRAASNSPMSESNDSGPDGPMGPLPAGVMDSLLATAGRISPLMQLILFVYRMLGAHLGLDPSLVLTLLGIFWGVSKVAGQVYVQVGDFIDRHFVCAMYVSEHDQIHSHLMNWLSRQQSISKSQYLMAQTVWKSAWEEEDDLESTLFFTDGGDADSGRQYLNFSNQAARSVRATRYASPTPLIIDLIGRVLDLYRQWAKLGFGTMEI